MTLRSMFALQHCGPVFVISRLHALIRRERSLQAGATSSPSLLALTTACLQVPCSTVVPCLEPFSCRQCICGDSCQSYAIRHALPTRLQTCMCPVQTSQTCRHGACPSSMPVAVCLSVTHAYPQQVSQPHYDLLNQPGGVPPQSRSICVVATATKQQDIVASVQVAAGEALLP